MSDTTLLLYQVAYALKDFDAKQTGCGLAKLSKGLKDLADRLSADKETIIAAAIRMPVTGWEEHVWNGKPMYPDFLTITAPPPARHGTLMHPFIDATGIRVPADNQGFITSTGRYVDRQEAHAIAVASGQPMIDHPSRIDGVLYSEDLW